MDNRTQTITVLLPAGTPAGTYEEKDILDTKYKRANGFATYVNKDGGVPNFKVGLRNDGAVFASPTNVTYFTASAACPKRDRLTPVAIACDNQNLTVQLVLPAPLTDDLNMDVVFNLER
jgi:hypothetical protein